MYSGMYSGMYTKYVCNLKQINFQQLKNWFFFNFKSLFIEKKVCVLDEDSARQKEQ